jgi:hypothetical protein
MPREGRESGANYPYTALCLSADRSWGNVVERYCACVAVTTAVITVEEPATTAGHLA